MIRDWWLALWANLVTDFRDDVRDLAWRLTKPTRRGKHRA